MRAGLATGTIMSQVSTNKSYFIHSVFADQVSKATIIVQSHLTSKGGFTLGFGIRIQGALQAYEVY
jgi:hypothetical protein